MAKVTSRGWRKESQMWKDITELEWKYLGNCWELL